MADAQQVGPYQILEELGRGGMGVVFRCRDVRSGEEVALKVLTSQGTATEAQLKRFRLEVEALAGLEHPNLVRLRDAGEHRGTPYMVLDCVRGQDLQARVNGAGPLLPWVAARILCKVAGALQVAHERGLVHRDVKPANIMINARNEPVLLDFGLVRSLDWVHSRITKTGAFVGTPGYWSPEQAASSQGLSPAADVYSLGATLYTALTGRPPYTGTTLIEVLDAMQRPIPPPSEFAPNALDPGLEAIVMRCLETDPAKRYADGGALAQALEGFLAGDRSARSPAQRPRSALPFALAGGLAAFVLGGLLLASRGDEPAPVEDPPGPISKGPQPVEPTPPTPNDVPPTPNDPPPQPPRARVASSLRLQDREACELARREMLRGVEGLPQRNFTPGPVLTYGPRAFPVFTAYGRQIALPLPLLAAAFHGQGRVAALGHTSYWKPKADGNGWKESAECRRLLENVIRWLNADRPLEQVRVGLTAPTDLEQLLRELGCQVEVLSVQEPDLAGVGLVMMPSETEYPMRKEAVAALVHFVEAGGGLFAAATGWGNQQLFERRGPFTLRRDFPINQVLAPMGLAYDADLYLDPQAKGRFAVAHSRTENVHAGDNLEDLFAGTSMAPGERRRAVVNVSEAAQAVTPDDPLLLPRLRQLLALAETPRAPTPQRPVTPDDTTSYLRGVLLSRDWEGWAPDEVVPAPGVEVFPGAVPQKARREAVEVEANPVARWSSTGLYAAPGEVITVRRAAAAVGWRVRIGCHARDLWIDADWRRWPEISRSWELKEQETRAASPFGGQVYLEPPRVGAGAPYSFLIEGAIPSPEFVLGDRFSERDWPASRQDPAPWGELRGRRVIFCLPSEILRVIDDPAAILRVWDALLDRRDAFAPPDPADPDPVLRLVFDVQVAGASGLWAADTPSVYRLEGDGRVPAVLRFDLLDAATGNDGYELIASHRGHPNWAWRSATFGINELLAQWLRSGRTGGEGWADCVWYGPAAASAREHLRRGVPVSLSREPTLGAFMFSELQRAFGWEPFRQVFAEFARKKKASSDDLRRGLWVLLLSRATGRNLIPFFQRFGVPADAALQELVAGLPAWAGRE